MMHSYSVLNLVRRKKILLIMDVWQWVACILSYKSRWLMISCEYYWDVWTAWSNASILFCESSKCPELVLQADSTTTLIIFPWSSNILHLKARAPLLHECSRGIQSWGSGRLACIFKWSLRCGLSWKEELYGQGFPLEISYTSESWSLSPYAVVVGWIVIEYDAKYVEI